MKTFADIFKSLGGYTGVAAAAEVPPGTASSWKTRKAIPAEYWLKISKSAQSRGIQGVTLEDLAGALAVRTSTSRKAA